MKKIDVLLPIYNEPLDYVSKSIQSILNQTYNCFKLIIIFDSPTNFEAINYVENLKTLDSRIITIKNEVNIGLVASLNKGITYCTDDYVARMDADDISELNRFEKQIKYLEENKLDFIGSNFVWFCDEKKIYRSQLPTSNKQIKVWLKHNSAFCHPTFFFKREILDKIQYEDAPYCEDYLFAIRLIENNFKLRNCPDYLLNYRLNNNGICKSYSSAQYVYAKYLRKKYKRKKKIIFSDFKEYINHPKTKKYIKKMERFFCLKNEFVFLNSKAKKISYLFKMLFISSSDFIYFMKEKLFHKGLIEYK